MFLPGADNFRFLEVKRMMNLVALPCLCVDVFDGTDELRAGGEALNFAVHASKFEEFNVSIFRMIPECCVLSCTGPVIKVTCAPRRAHSSANANPIFPDE